MIIIFIFIHPRTGLNVSGVCYSKAIHACYRAEQYHRGLDLFEEMVAKGHRPNGLDFECALAACVQEQNADKALTLVDQMEKDVSRLS